MSKPVQATKHVLSDSMKELLRKKSIEKISTDEICRNAGVSRRNFYRHFSDKYDLLQWIYYTDFCVDNVHYKDWCIWDYFPAITAHLYTDRYFYANAFDFEGQNSFRSFCYDRLYPILHRDYGESFESRESEDFFLRHIVYMTFDGFVEWLRSEPCMPPEEYAATTQKKFERFIAALEDTLAREPAKNRTKEAVFRKAPEQ